MTNEHLARLAAIVVGAALIGAGTYFFLFTSAVSTPVKVILYPLAMWASAVCAGLVGEHVLRFLKLRKTK